MPAAAARGFCPLRTFTRTQPRSPRASWRAAPAPTSPARSSRSTAASAIRRAWDAEPPALYGRFDLVYDGSAPARLLEFNADTPTGLVESAVTQWNWHLFTGQGRDQWNALHDTLVAAWQRNLTKWEYTRMGVESEMELAFASLHQLCAPLLEAVEQLPLPQRGALEIADIESKGAVAGKQNHRPLEAHPTISDDILSRIAHGEVTPKPNIARLTERTVVFADGSEVEADIAPMPGEEA